MPTTIRVEDDVKTAFDKLLGLMLHETGERLSQSELLARLVRLADRRLPDLLEGERDWHPPTRAQLARVLRGGKDYPATDSSAIDDALFGDTA